MNDEAKCPHCGAALPSTEGVVTCAACRRRIPFIRASAEARSEAHLAIHVKSPNASTARRLALEQAVDDVERAVQNRNNHDAQLATKRALEAIHELQDCANRSEWSMSGWSKADAETWNGLLGARNIAHHTSAGVVALHGEGLPQDHLKWDIDASALGELRSRAQARAYNARLANQPVLPQLRALLARIQAPLP
jgi:uncharacterized Zn finger protein (UPF0148 family)